MSEQGLKALKNGTHLDGLTVTPELKARLKQRIQQAEAEGWVPDRGPRHPWLRPAVYTAAVVCVLALAMVVGPAARPLTDSGPAVQPAPLPPPYQQAGSNTVLTAGQAARTDSYNAFTITVYDQAGNPVRGQAQLYTPPAGAEAQPGRRIITNGEYGIRVADARAAVERLQQEAAAAGGYVAEATLNKETTGSWTGRVVLRVPETKAAGTIALLGQVGSVERERQWTQDVTDQYMDLEHRIEILQEHEASLRQLAEKAATFDDWNKVAGQMNATRTEIENTAGKLKLLSNQVEFAILNIQVVQPAPGEAPVAKGATTVTGQMGESFLNSLRALGARLRQVILGLAALGPYLLILLPAAAGLAVWRRRRRKAA